MHPGASILAPSALDRFSRLQHCLIDRYLRRLDLGGNAPPNIFSRTAPALKWETPQSTHMWRRLTVCTWVSVHTRRCHWSDRFACVLMYGPNVMMSVTDVRVIYMWGAVFIPTVSMSVSMTIYIAHKHETSNALNALVRSKHKRFDMLPKRISANSRITQVVRQGVPHWWTSHRESDLLTAYNWCDQGSLSSLEVLKSSVIYHIQIQGP